MHAKLREIIDSKPCCRETIREGSQYLPEDAGELDAWIAKSVEDLDSLAFGYLVMGALHRGLPVQSRHLELGLKFLPGYQSAIYLILHVIGDDIPERVARALQLGGISSVNYGYFLIATWHWCDEHGVPFPENLINAARGYAHRFQKQPNCAVTFLCFALLIDDQRIMEMMTGSKLSEDDRKPLMEKKKEACEKFQAIYRGEALKTVAEKPKACERPKTVRRAVEHIGRNEPCPCGSGKKHKRCCYEKTQERLLHSSDVAGMTMEELDSDLEAHMTLERLNTLNNVKLMRLDPLKLDPSLIQPLLDRLNSWKLYEEAAAVLEKVGLTDELCDLWDHLVILAAESKRKKVVSRLVSLHPNPGNLEEKEYIHVAARLLLAEGDAEKTLVVLEETAQMLVTDPNPGKFFFHGMGFTMSPLGSLGIMLTHAALAQMGIKEAISLLQFVTTKRAQLDLPLEDPFVEIIDNRIAAEARKEENKDSAKLAAAMRKMDALAEKERKGAENARQMQRELAKLTKEAEQRKEAEPDAPSHDDSEMKALREKLRIHEANEKINAEERAAHRRTTTDLLLWEESLREKERKLKKAAPSGEESDEDTQVMEGELEGTQPLRLITFPGKFLKSIDSFPRHVARQALALLGRIASGEPAAFHDVLRLKACHDIFRARVGIDYRMLFRLHAEELEVIALINRRDLDARIKTLQKHQ